MLKQIAKVNRDRPIPLNLYMEGSMWWEAEDKLVAEGHDRGGEIFGIFVLKWCILVQKYN